MTISESSLELYVNALSQDRLLVTSYPVIYQGTKVAEAGCLVYVSKKERGSTKYTQITDGDKIIRFNQCFHSYPEDWINDGSLPICDAEYMTGLRALTSEEKEEIITAHIMQEQLKRNKLEELWELARN